METEAINHSVPANGPGLASRGQFIRPKIRHCRRSDNGGPTTSPDHIPSRTTPGRFGPSDAPWPWFRTYPTPWPAGEQKKCRDIQNTVTTPFKRWPATGKSGAGIGVRSGANVEEWLYLTAYSLPRETRLIATLFRTYAAPRTRSPANAIRSLPVWGGNTTSRASKFFFLL